MGQLAMLIDLLGLFIGILGIAFGVWQYQQNATLKKIVNDHVRGLYKNSKKILEFAKKENNYQTIAERARAIKESVVRLDIINRNLSHDDIDSLREKKRLSEDEAREYKTFTSD